MEDGSYTLKKRSALPSSSAINWASMFMGAGPELHGYTEWGSKTPELPSRVLNKNGIFPTVFQLLRDARPEAEIGCLYEWEGIKYLVDTLSLNYHYHVADCNKTPKELGNMASAYIKRNILLLLPSATTTPTIPDILKDMILPPIMKNSKSWIYMSVKLSRL